MSASEDEQPATGSVPNAPLAHLTIEEVGRMAGVSRNTVSLALAGSPRVRPETRQRVLQVVQATGYRRNPAAAALAGGSTRTLAVVEFGPPAYLSDRAYLGFVAGIEEGTSANGYDLLLLSARRPAEPRWLLTLARARRFDGVVLLGAATDRDAVAELLAQHIPAVHIGRRVISGHDLPYVTPDYVCAGRLAVQRLVHQGARHIVYLTAVNQPESKADMRAGIAEEVRRQAALGVAVTTAAAELGDLRALLPPTALTGLIVHGSRTAMAVWRTQTAAAAPPAMVAYDDEGWLAEALPALDRLQPPKRLIGRQAALLALDLIAKRRLAQPHLALPPEASWATIAANRAPGNTDR